MFGVPGVIGHRQTLQATTEKTLEPGGTKENVVSAKTSGTSSEPVTIV